MNRNLGYPYNQQYYPPSNSTTVPKIGFGLLCAAVLFVGCLQNMSRSHRRYKHYPRKKQKKKHSVVHGPYKTSVTTITVSDEDVFANSMSLEEAKAHYEKTKKYE